MYSTYIALYLEELCKAVDRLNCETMVLVCWWWFFAREQDFLGDSRHWLAPTAKEITDLAGLALLVPIVEYNPRRTFVGNVLLLSTTF